MLNQSHTPVNSKLVEIKLACASSVLNLRTDTKRSCICFQLHQTSPSHRPSQSDAADNLSDAMATSVWIWIVLINISTVQTFVIPPEHVELAVSNYEALSP